MATSVEAAAGSRPAPAVTTGKARGPGQRSTGRLVVRYVILVILSVIVFWLFRERTEKVRRQG